MANDDPSAGTRTTAQLVDLVLNPRDLGYEQAAARRGPDPAPRWYDRPAVVLGCLVIGFVLVVAYVHTHRGAPDAAKVHQSLVDRVHAAERQDASLAAGAQRLNGQLNAARSSALPTAGALKGQLARNQQLAGQTAVTGPGLKVSLADPPAPTPTAEPGRVGTVPITATHILSDRDVRSVVNELWADGAEAISVNNIRLTPTSAIRFAGQAVLIDFQPITSPYTVRAIGEADDLATSFAASEVASRYQTLAGAQGIGFRFSESESLSLPANAGEQPSFAAPLTPTSRSTR
jgi:uncharacterized protein YlxW (UPF0749 family)